MKKVKTILNMMPEIRKYLKHIKTETKIGPYLYKVYGFLFHAYRIIKWLISWPTLIPVMMIRDGIYFFLRKHGLKTKRYEKLYNMRNKHKGERCFIVGGGPSLTYEDIEKLKHEKTFFVNSIVLEHDKISYKPTYYGVQDNSGFQPIKNMIYESGYPAILWGRVCDRSIRIPVEDTRPEWIEFPSNGTFTTLCVSYELKFFLPKFSTDASVAVFENWTVVISMIQIAVFLGFSEIYLLGCDCCNYSGKNHFINYPGEEHKSWNIPFISNIKGYQKAKEYADSHNIKIYNATRGGMLEVFERVNLDDILKK